MRRRARWAVVEPIPQADVLAPETLAAKGQVPFKLAHFETSRGRINKTGPAPQGRLGAREPPQDAARGRSRGVRGRARRARRAGEPAPPSPRAVDAAGRRRPGGAAAREAARGTRSRESRPASRPRRAAQGPASGLAHEWRKPRRPRMRAGDAASSDALRRSSRLKSASLLPAVLPDDDHDAEAGAAGHCSTRWKAADPALKPRADDLRRRLLALGPGETGGRCSIASVDQRTAERARVRDEITLREAGVAPPASALLAGPARHLRDALERPWNGRLGEHRGDRAPGHRSRRSEERAAVGGASSPPPARSATSWTGPPSACSPAGHILVRATFVHAPHLLQAACLGCHGGWRRARSRRSTSTGWRAASECHRPRSEPAGLLVLSPYHPQAMP